MCASSGSTIAKTFLHSIASTKYFSSYSCTLIDTFFLIACGVLFETFLCITILLLGRNYLYSLHLVLPFKFGGGVARKSKTSLSISDCLYSSNSVKGFRKCKQQYYTAVCSDHSCESISFSKTTLIIKYICVIHANM